MSMRTRAVIAISIAALLGLIYAGIARVRQGFSAKDTPSKIEEYIARNMRRIAIPADAKRLSNPYSPASAITDIVRDHWVEHCALCHGVDGSGDAPIGQNLYPKATDLRSASVQSLSDGEIFYIISNGVRFTGMPAWSERDTSEEIWQFVSLIRRFRTLTPAELEFLKQETREQMGPASEPETSVRHAH